MKITFEDINKAIANAANANRTPDPALFPVYAEGSFIDEEKSVKWNKEEIARRNEAWRDEKKRLDDEYAKLVEVANEIYIKYMAQQMNVSCAKAKIIYSYLYANHYTSKSRLYREVEDFIDMFNNLSKVD